MRPLFGALALQSFNGFSLYLPTVAAMAHAAHSTRSAHVAHRMHSMGPAEAGFKTRAMTDASCGRHLGSVASAHVRGTLTMNGCALAMDRAHVLRMHRCLA